MNKKSPPVKLSELVAEQKINELAKAGSGNVIFTTHAQEQMLKRGISSRDVMDALCHGYVDSLARYNEDYNNWAYRTVLEIEGRNLGVVTVILDETQKLRVVTTLWKINKI